VGVSRRQFLGRLGAGLAAAAGALMAQRALAGNNNILCDPTYSDAACDYHLVGSRCTAGGRNGRCTAQATIAPGLAACYCRTPRG
jgi:hypothetical protein